MRRNDIYRMDDRDGADAVFDDCAGEDKEMLLTKRAATTRGTRLLRMRYV